MQPANYTTVSSRNIYSGNPRIIIHDTREVTINLSQLLIVDCKATVISCCCLRKLNPMNGFYMTIWPESILCYLNNRVLYVSG